MIRAILLDLAYVEVRARDEVELVQATYADGVLRRGA